MTDVLQHMKKILIVLALSLSFAASAQEEEEREIRTPAELASESDFVLLARLEAYEYEERREIPVEGKTWFDVLVPYKVPSPTERVQVKEEGFGENKCYFADVTLWGDLPRYLLFLIRDEEGDIRGHPDGCAIPVLITTDNKYAVRWPLENVEVGEEAENMVQEFEFHGAGAFIDLSEMTSIRREETVEQKYLVKTDSGKHRYTRGILLEDFRQVLGKENLTKDRIQLGR